MKAATQPIEAPSDEAQFASDADLTATLGKGAVRQVMSALPDFVVVLDRGLRVLTANRGAGRLTAAQLEGQHVTTLLPKRLHAVALATLQRVLASGQEDGYAAEIEGEDGQSMHFDVRISPLRRGDAIVALTLNAAERTDQIRAERAIATQARMIESMLEGVAVVNENGVIEITNPAFDTMFGYARGDAHRPGNEHARRLAVRAARPVGERDRRECELDQR